LRADGFAAKLNGMPRPYRIDPVRLRERNSKGGIAAHSIEAHIKAIVRRKDELTPELRDELAVALRSVSA
jgi:hypothetical protein